jgi:hypothetical protein
MWEARAMTMRDGESLVGLPVGRVMGTVGLVAVLVASAGAWPGRALAGEDLPSGKELMAQYVKALGGKAALEKIHNRVTQGTMEITAQNVSMTFTAYEAEPDKTYTVVESEMMGRVEEGTNQGVAWVKHPMMGPRVKEGEERARALHDATFNEELKWGELYAKVECTDTSKVEGKDCYTVVLTPQAGQPETWHLDKQTYRRVKLESVLEGPMGRIPVVTLEKDFKQVDGVWISHEQVQEVAMQKFVVKVSSVKHNVELPADRFELPEEIKALLESQEKAKQAAPS